MHEMRNILTSGGRATLLAKRAPREKKGAGASLSGVAIPRSEARSWNQRREERHLNVAERAEVLFRRRKYEVAVVNVSKHGAMIECALEPRIGERMQISFEGCNRTECTVRWLRDTRIGLEFSQETQIIASPAVRELIVSGRREGEAGVGPDKPSREPRQRLLWKAVLHWDHGSVAVRLRNISAEGAMLECGEDLPPDTEVVLDLGDGGSASGRVRWSRSGQLGLNFHHRFDLRSLVRTDAADDHSPQVLKPLYLETEGEPDSPWAAAWDKLSPDDLGEQA
ncbi:MAG: PilZ domain-containing protein [Pseudomonadota bacterium]|nr:PilZ domain-containing protein [Pseudomonadota bacterium]